MALLNSCCCVGLRPAVTLLGVLSLLGGIGWAGKGCWDLFLVINGDLTDDYLLPFNAPTASGEELLQVTQELNITECLKSPTLNPELHYKIIKNWNLDSQETDDGQDSEGSGSSEILEKEARSLALPPAVTNITEANYEPPKNTANLASLESVICYKIYLENHRDLLRYVLIPMFVVNVVCGVITFVYSCILIHGARKVKQYLLLPVLFWWPIHAAIQILFICLLKMLTGLTNPYPWSITTLSISGASLIFMVVHWIATFSLRQQMKEMKNFPVGFYNHPQLSPIYSQYPPGVYMGPKTTYS